MKKLLYRLFHPLPILLALTIGHETRAQSFDNVIPMEEWATFKEVVYDGQPILVHLRTGYERAVLLPEPVEIETVEGKKVSYNNSDNLIPGCRVELDVDVLGFSPFKRFAQHKLVLRGLNSGTKYELIVHSSPQGRRQPIDIRR